MTDQPEHHAILFQRISEGDEAAFDAVYHMFLPKLYPLVMKFTKSEPAAQEVMQEIFIRVWMNRDKLADIENPGGWLFRVASNECYAHLRKKALTNGLFVVSDAEITSSAGVGATQEWLDHRDLTRLIHMAVDRLPAQRQRIYRMSRQEGKTIAEIAAELGLSPNTIKNTLVSALRSIREELVRSGVVLFALEILFP